jgi:glucokinase
MSAFKRDLAMSAADVGVGLIGDIGATNARFALVLPGGKTTQPLVCALDDYASLSDAVHVACSVTSLTGRSTSSRRHSSVASVSNAADPAAVRHRIEPAR